MFSNQGHWPAATSAMEGSAVEEQSGRLQEVQRRQDLRAPMDARAKTGLRVFGASLANLRVQPPSGKPRHAMLLTTVHHLQSSTTTRRSLARIVHALPVHHRSLLSLSFALPESPLDAVCLHSASSILRLCRAMKGKSLLFCLTLTQAHRHAVVTTVDTRTTVHSHNP